MQPFPLRVVPVTVVPEPDQAVFWSWVIFRPAAKVERLRPTVRRGGRLVGASR
jgi:hypothetical protein